MDDLEKLLNKASRRDRERILSALLLIRTGKLEHVKLQKLSGKNQYRVRIGRYRILCSLDAQSKMDVDSVRLRNEKTDKQ